MEIRFEHRLTYSLTAAEILYTSSTVATDGEPVLRILMLRDRHVFAFCYNDGPRFFIDQQGHQVLAQIPATYSLEDACTYLLGPVLGFVLRVRGVVCLHASAVAVADQAICLVGPQGAGKSTMAALFARRGYRVISDDVVALCETVSGEFQVQPGYPRVNLWPDSVDALFGAPDALPRITQNWDKRYLALGPSAFAVEPLPLRAIYLLDSRGSTPESGVRNLLGSESLLALLGNTYANYFIRTDMRSCEFDLLSRVAMRVPVRVTPRRDPSAATCISDAILSDVATLPPPELLVVASS